MNLSYCLDQRNLAVYIHHVVCDLRSENRPVTDDIVENLVFGRLTDPLDEWHLDHYGRRLTLYYGR